jgi:hypothetical protein
MKVARIKHGEMIDFPVLYPKAMKLLTAMRPEAQDRPVAVLAFEDMGKFLGYAIPPEELPNLIMALQMIMETLAPEPRTVEIKATVQ